MARESQERITAPVCMLTSLRTDSYVCENHKILFAHAKWQGDPEVLHPIVTCIICCVDGCPSKAKYVIPFVVEVTVNV